MLLVDTTVWIDFFAGREVSHVVYLEKQLLHGENICICGVILAEVLQGIRDDKSHSKTRRYFGALAYLPMDRHVYLRAADIYRGLRKKGITIRNSVDCMIAAVAIEHDVPLLHNDKDYSSIERHHRLRTASG